MNTQHKLADLTGRVLISAMFLQAGLAKIAGFTGTQGYMEAMGVPGALLPLVILATMATVVGRASGPERSRRASSDSPSSSSITR